MDEAKIAGGAFVLGVILVLLAFVLISNVVHRVRKSLADSRTRTELDALANESRLTPPA